MGLHYFNYFWERVWQLDANQLEFNNQKYKFFREKKSIIRFVVDYIHIVHPCHHLPFNKSMEHLDRMVLHIYGSHREQLCTCQNFSGNQIMVILLSFMTWRHKKGPLKQWYTQIIKAHGHLLIVLYMLMCLIPCDFKSVETIFVIAYCVYLCEQ